MKKIYFVAYLLICIMLCSCNKSAAVANNTTSVQDTGEVETTTSIEEVHKQFFTAIENYPEFDKYTQKVVTYDFIQWVGDKTGTDIFKALYDSIQSSAYSNDFWYNTTGKTLHVLHDWYNGTITDDEASFSNNSSGITLGFAGDICLSEGWSTLEFYDNHNKDLSQGISNGLIELTNSYDLFMLNNEFTYSTRGNPLEGKYYTFRAHPDRVSIIQELGTDIVSLSNNHVYDYGNEAFYDTLDTLKAAGIPYVGAGRNMKEAKAPVYFVINGVKIGYVGANRSEKIIFTPEATNNSPGVLRTYDSAKYLKAIKQAKANCDYLIAYVHWGTEDSNVVTDYQKEMGHEYIDAGADAVIGGHPHVLQGVEYYKGHPIAYSMGDFWFNDFHDNTGLLKLTIDHTGLRETTFIPCLRDSGITSLVTDPEEARDILDYMESISFGVTIDDNGTIH